MAQNNLCDGFNEYKKTPPKKKKYRLITKKQHSLILFSRYPQSYPQGRIDAVNERSRHKPNLYTKRMSK